MYINYWAFILLLLKINVANYKSFEGPNQTIKSKQIVKVKLLKSQL